MFDEVAEIIEREFHDRAFLDARWPEIREEHRPRYEAAVSAEEREAAVSGLLEGLGVSHCILLVPEMQEKIEAAEQDPRRLKPEWRRDGETLFVAIRSCKVPTTRREDLIAIAAELEKVREVVLDLRLNDGGSGGVVSDIASLFVEPETAVLCMRDRTGFECDQPHVIHTLPEDENQDHMLEVATLRQHHHVEYRTHDWAGIRFAGRVVVLVDRTCYSCGEVLAQALKEHAGASVVGRATAGMVVAARSVDMSGGYGLLVPFAQMRSGLGVVLEGEGCVPHVEVDLSGRDADGALTWLRDEGLLAKPRC